MKSTGSAARAAVFGLWALLSAPAAHAQQQFLLLDTTYTATEQNTSDSHYAAMPAAGVPNNWTAPTDYTKGKAYVELDILQKPSNASTLYNICFENDSGAACLPYGPAYTATGHTAWNADLAGIYNFKVVDWTKGVTKVSLILKDAMENKTQGDANFYPYQAHVVISIVPQGATYMMPASSGGAAGSSSSAGAGGRMSGSAGRRAAAGSGGMRASAGGSGGASAGAAGKTSGSAGMTPAGGAADAGVHDAGSAGSSAGVAGITSSAANGGSGGKPASNATAGTASNVLGEAGHTSAVAQLEDSSGCTIARARGGSRLGFAFMWLAIAAVVRVRARRRRR